MPRQCSVAVAGPPYLPGVPAVVISWLAAPSNAVPTASLPCRYLHQPAAFLASSCGCGCATDWQRCLVPLGGSRAAREAQLRDPALAIKVG